MATLGTVRSVTRVGVPAVSGRALQTTRMYSYATPEQPKRKPGRGLFWLLAATFSTGLGYITGAKFPPRAIPFLFSPYTTNVKTMSKQDSDAHVLEIEAGLHKLPMVRELAEVSIETPSAQRTREAYGIARVAKKAVPAEEAEYLIVRPFTHAPQEALSRQFTAGSLRGPGMFATPPLLFSKTKRGAALRGGREGDTLAFVHVGQNLCGFEGVIHGGLIATLFDEALARAAFYALPSNIGVTAKLEVSYQKPALADRYFLLDAHVTENSGRKAFVHAELSDATSECVVAHADAVFVEPKFAKYVSWVGGVNVRKLMEE